MASLSYIFWYKDIISIRISLFCFILDLMIIYERYNSKYENVIYLWWEIIDIKEKAETWGQTDVKPVLKFEVLSWFDPVNFNSIRLKNLFYHCLHCWLSALYNFNETSIKKGKSTIPNVHTGKFDSHWMPVFRAAAVLKPVL